MVNQNTIILIIILYFILTNSLNCKKEYFTYGACKKCAIEKKIEDPCTDSGIKCIGKYKGCTSRTWDNDFDSCFDMDDDDKNNEEDDNPKLSEYPDYLSVNSCIDCMQLHLNKKQKEKLCSFKDPKKATDYLLDKCQNYCTDDGDISMFNRNIKTIGPLKTKICIDLKKI
jgi:hypothetical protein